MGGRCHRDRLHAGRTNLKGIMLGSTTNKLLHLTSLPVVVVR